MKNKILWGITYTAVALGMVAGCFWDSENCMPFVAAVAICGAWVALFYEANKNRFESEC